MKVPPNPPTPMPPAPPAALPPAPAEPSVPAPPMTLPSSGLLLQCNKKGTRTRPMDEIGKRRSMRYPLRAKGEDQLRDNSLMMAHLARDARCDARAGNRVRCACTTAAALRHARTRATEL